MTARFRRLIASGIRVHVLSTPCFVVGIFLVVLAADSALAAGTPEQRRACTPDVYRLCPGEIPNVRAITACLRRQKANLSEACRAAFEQADH